MYEHYDYTAITELPGSALTTEQWQRIHHRYALARNLAGGRRVLEVACGAGAGLSALAAVASRAAGGDYTSSVMTAAYNSLRQHNLQARTHSTHSSPPRPATIHLAQYDAHKLPFADASFELILLFEAIYYLAAPDAFLAEARRTLAPGGQLLIGSENPNWPAFTPGKLSTRYLNSAELHRMLGAHGFGAIECLGAFPVTAYTARQRQAARIRRYLLRSGFVPNHPALRRLLQRLSYGNLRPLPPILNEAELDHDHAPVQSLAPAAPNAEYKVIYLCGTAL